MNQPPQLIKSWEELSKVPPSATHRLEIDVQKCNGWIYRIADTEGNDSEVGRYLSTHTFYGSTHEASTKRLQACGFNVIIDNWDK